MVGREDWGSFESLTPEQERDARKRYRELMRNETPRSDGPDYTGFVDDVRNKGINVRTFDADSERKDRLLKKYFPGRYKTFKWEIWEKNRKGALFKKLYEYSQRHYKE